MTPHEHHHTVADPDDHRTPTEYWDDRYREQDAMWRFRPNAVLAAEVPGFGAAGTALDLGAGEGGDAIWLGGHGWSVTALDISRVALDRGAHVAADRGLADRIRWVQTDLSTWAPSDQYDLVTSHFLHSPVPLASERILRTATAAVAPGGRMLVVKHAGFPDWAPEPRPVTTFPDAERVVLDLELDPDGWVVEIAEERPRDATAPDGSVVAVDDVVVLVRRRG
jgi:SAM-dependent methyltransferase